MATDNTESDGLAERVTRLEAELATAKRRRHWPLLALAGGLAIGAAAAFGYWAVEVRDKQRIETAAATVADGLPALAGYPLRFEADGGALTASGLAPSTDAKDALARALTAVAEAEGLTLRLLVGTPPTAGDRPAAARWADLKPYFAEALTPVASAAADAAIRIDDVERAIAAGLAERTALRASIAALAADHAAAATRLEGRLAMLDREAAILSAEIAAVERVAERRSDRIADDLRRQGAELTVRDDELDAGTARLAEMTANTAEQVEGLNSRSDSADEARASLAKETEGLRDAQTVLRQGVAMAAEHRTRLEAAANANAALLDGLAKRLETATAARAALAARIDDADATLLDKADVSDLGALSARIDGVDATLTDKADAEAIDALAAKIDGAGAMLATKAGADDLSALAARLDEVMTESAGVRSAIEDMVAEASAMSERVDDMAARAQGVDQSVTVLEASLAERDGAAKRLEAEMASWRVALDASTTASRKIVATTPVATTSTATAAGPAVSKQLEAIEARAGEAIALLDQRIDRVAQAAQQGQPRAASALQATSQKLGTIRIRFASSAQPANANEADQTLAEVSEIMLAAPAEVRLRVIGYADSDGTTEANRITSKRRSDWAVEKLASFGVPKSRMVSVGRGAERLLSPDASDDSPNRRVEFEAF